MSCKFSRSHLIALVLTLLVLACSQATTALAAGRRPVLVVKARPDGSVRVVMQIEGQFVGPSSTLELERMNDYEDTYIPIGQYQCLKRRTAIINNPTENALYFYRARLVLPHGHSRWSAVKGVIVTVPATPPETPLFGSQSECASSIPQEVLDSVNSARVAEGRPSLTLHTQLQWSARTHTLMMADAQDFSHGSWSDIIRQSGFQGNAIGENIAIGQATGVEVVEWWLNSPGHRKNILSADYDYLGIGCVVDSQGQTWWAQNFGGRKVCGGQ